MTANVQILASVAASGKTQRLLRAYRSALAAARRDVRPGTTLWISPTSRSARWVLEQLLDDSLPACFAPNVFTFEAFAEELLQSAGEQLARLPESGRRMLLRSIIEQARRNNELSYFSRIAHTSGFLDLVVSLVAELKRDETWPEDFARACRNHGETPKDRELSVIYARYQEHLLRLRLYDAQGTFWSARQLLESGRFGAFGDLSLVVVDGFADFTVTQYEILAQLARRAGEMIVSLPLETPLSRADLFAKTLAARERIEGFAKSGCKVATDTSAEPIEKLPPMIRQISDRLFANPRHVQRETSADGLEVLAATGQRGEIEAVAERVKRTLLAGARPHEIVVAFRSLDDYDDLVEEIFSAANIPFCCDAGVPLARSPLLQALHGVLMLEREDWPFNRLMSVLDSNYFRPRWKDWTAGAAQSVSRVLRNYKLHAQRSTILRSVERLDDYERSRTTGKPNRKIVEALPVARRTLQALSVAMDRLRSPATFGDWARRLVSLAEELGIAPAPGRASDGKSPLDDRDRRAWDDFTKTLFDAAKTEAYLEDEPTEIDLGEFMTRMADLLSSHRVFPRLSEAGKVRVLEASHVRSLEVPYLFLAGLTESSFPGSRGEDCLYNEAERRTLSDAGVSLGHQTSHTQDEMLMFYQVITRARRELVLSFPEISSDGQPLFPSPYVTAVRDLFEPGAISTIHVGQLDPVPERDRAINATDLRLVATSDVRERRPGLFATLLDRQESRPAALNVVAGVDAAVSRFHTRGYTAYEGLVRSGHSQTRLRQLFPADYQFSATQLESYAGCPFRFFLQHVLHVEPLEPPQVTTDHRARGSLLHQVMKALYTGDVEEVLGAPPDELKERFRKVVDERVGRHVSDSKLQQALMRVEQSLLHEWAELYSEQCEEYRKTMEALCESLPKPVALEVPFGVVPDEEGDGAGTEAKYPAITVGKGENLTRVRGRIDRIDTASTDDGLVYLVIDYKSGKKRQFGEGDVECGKSLQLALYTLAVKRLGLVDPGAVPIQMAYWFIRESGFTSGLKSGNKRGVTKLDTATLAALEQMLDDLVPRLAQGIRSGTFPIYSQDNDCTGLCPYNTACRVNQLRPLEESLDKKLQVFLPQPS